jgi:hypothetical protein
MNRPPLTSHYAPFPTYKGGLGLRAGATARMNRRPGLLSCTMAHAASRTARPRAQASEAAGPSGRSGEMAAARHRGPARNNRVAGLGPSFLACLLSTLAGAGDVAQASQKPQEARSRGAAKAATGLL